MAFDKKKFSPVHVNAGTYAPRIFSYCNTEDLLSEIMEPGYFNERHILLRANTFMKVICQDTIVELVIETNINQNVIMKDEFLRFTDPYKESMKPTRVRRTTAQILADKEKADLAKAG